MDGQAAAEMASLDEADESDIMTGPAPKLQRVATRAKKMIEILNANGFVSFG